MYASKPGLGCSALDLYIHIQPMNDHAAYQQELFKDACCSADSQPKADLADMASNSAVAMSFFTRR